MSDKLKALMLEALAGEHAIAEIDPANEVRNSFSYLVYNPDDSDEII